MLNKNHKTIGILGGMGPLATSILFEKIIINTNVVSECQHLPIVIYNNPQIPDRTNYILHKSNDPTSALIDSARFLQQSGVSFIVMPCNTAHYFIDEIQRNINIPIVNMIERTAEYIQTHYKNINHIGLMATTGCLKAQIFQQYFNKINIEIIEPLPIDQEQVVMKAIYQAKHNQLDIAKKNFMRIINYFQSKKVKNILLGCSEISAIFKNDRERYIDPLEILAKKAIELATN